MRCSRFLSPTRPTLVRLPLVDIMDERIAASGTREGIKYAQVYDVSTFLRLIGRQNKIRAFIVSLFR